MKILKPLLLTLIIAASLGLNAQVAINTDGSNADASAILDVKSTEKGFLPPRMTASQIENIAGPADGLMVFNTTDHKVYIFVSADNEWKELNYGAGTITPGGSVTDTDGNTYNIITIGNQVWMAENLKVTHYPNGDAIPHITDNTAWDNLAANNTDDAYCFYNNNQNNEADTYGALYTYAAAIGDNWARDNTANQGVCPNGWHIPTDEEWKTMEMALGMSQAQADATSWRGTDEGGKMKETGTAHWNSPNTGATNSSGFIALPGGKRDSNGSFHNIGGNGYWWSSTEYSGSSAWYRSLFYNNAQVYRSGNDKTHGFSVRCLKN